MKYYFLILMLLSGYAHSVVNEELFDKNYKPKYNFEEVPWDTDKVFVAAWDAFFIADRDVANKYLETFGFSMYKLWKCSPTKIITIEHPLTGNTSYHRIVGKRDGFCRMMVRDQRESNWNECNFNDEMQDVARRMYENINKNKRGFEGYPREAWGHVATCQPKAQSSGD